VKANQAHYPVRVMCRLLKVSQSGFYAWEGRALSARAREDIRLTALIHAIHGRSQGAYGAPSIHAELADDHGIHVGCKRVARLMRAAGLFGVTQQRFIRTTVADPAAERALDLVERQFIADGPDRLWVADITYGTPSQRSPPVRGVKLLEHVWNAVPGGVGVAVPGHALPLLRGEVSRSGGDLPTLAR
jgi:hypothetical protein